METNVILHDAVWSSGEFKIKMPCDISKIDSGKPAQELPGAEKTLSCVVGNLKFSVSSKKSKESLRAEFDEIKDEKTAKEIKSEEFIFIDYPHSKNSVRTRRIFGFPISSEIKFEIMKNRLYLIDDKWLIHFEVTCGSAEEKYCREKMNNGDDEQIDEFFNSLKLIK